MTATDQKNVATAAAQFRTQIGAASYVDGALARSAVQPGDIPSSIIAWLASLPQRSGGDISGLAPGDWLILNGQLTQVQP